MTPHRRIGGSRLEVVGQDGPVGTVAVVVDAVDVRIGRVGAHRRIAVVAVGPEITAESIAIAVGIDAHPAVRPVVRVGVVAVVVGSDPVGVGVRTRAREANVVDVEVVLARGSVDHQSPGGVGVQRRRIVDRAAAEAEVRIVVVEPRPAIEINPRRPIVELDQQRGIGPGRGGPPLAPVRPLPPHTRRRVDGDGGDRSLIPPQAQGVLAGVDRVPGRRVGDRPIATGGIEHRRIDRAQLEVVEQLPPIRPVAVLVDPVAEGLGGTRVDLGRRVVAVRPRIRASGGGGGPEAVAVAVHHAGRRIVVGGRPRERLGVGVVTVGVVVDLAVPGPTPQRRWHRGVAEAVAVDVGPVRGPAGQAVVVVVHQAIAVLVDAPTAHLGGVGVDRRIGVVTVAVVVGVAVPFLGGADLDGLPPRPPEAVAVAVDEPQVALHVVVLATRAAPHEEQAQP